MDEQVTTWQFFIAAVAFCICGLLIEYYSDDNEDMFTGIMLMSMWGLSVCCIARVMFNLMGD